MDLKVVGWKELGQLLQPGHPYFADKWGMVDEFKSYNGDGEWLLYPRVKAEDRLNPYRKRQLSRANSGRTIGKILGLVEAWNLQHFKVTHMVLTFPEELSVYLRDHPHGREIAWRAFARFWHEDYGTLEEDSSGQAGYINLHTWKSRTPIEAHYHFHCLIPNYRDVRAEGIEDEDGEPAHEWKEKTWHRQRGGTFVPFSDELRLELQRRWWLRLRKLAKRHGVKVPVLRDPGGWQRVDIYYKFIQLEAEYGKAQLMRAMNYQGRHPIEDYAVYSNRDLEAPNPPAWLTTYENRTRVFGWWRQLGTLARGGIGEMEAKRHPVSGKPMESLGTMSLEGVLANCGGKLGYIDFDRGKPVEGMLTADDIEWLRNVMWDPDPRVRYERRARCEAMGRSQGRAKREAEPVA